MSYLIEGFILLMVFFFFFIVPQKGSNSTLTKRILRIKIIMDKAMVGGTCLLIFCVVEKLREECEWETETAFFFFCHVIFVPL